MEDPLLQKLKGCVGSCWDPQQGVSWKPSQHEEGQSGKVCGRWRLMLCARVQGVH